MRAYHTEMLSLLMQYIQFRSIKKYFQIDAADVFLTLIWVFSKEVCLRKREKSLIFTYLYFSFPEIG